MHSIRVKYIVLEVCDPNVPLLLALVKGSGPFGSSFRPLAPIHR